MRFAAFFKIYQILKLKSMKFDKILQTLRHLHFLLLKFHEKCCFFKPIFCENFEIAAMQKYANLVELENAVKRIFPCKISFDTAENEPAGYSN